MKNLTIVAYLIYWVLRMSSLPLIADAVLAGGVIAAVGAVGLPGVD